MEDTTYDRPSLSRSETGRGSMAGSIALLSVFAGGLAAASYPLLTAALAVGVVAGYLTRRVTPAIRRRTREATRIPETAARSGAGATSPLR